MSEEKKKKGQPNKGVNAFLFILFWLISIVFLQTNSWTMWSNIYTFVAVDFPEFLQRLWIAYLFHGLVIGLGVGLAQKAAIQALSPINLKYWLRTSVFLTVAAKMGEYLLLRYIDWRGNYDPSLYYLALNLGFQLLMIVVQSWILRRHYQRAWLWLLLIIPSLLTWTVAYMPTDFLATTVLQALLSTLLLLLMNRQTIPAEKAKNIEAAEARLADTSIEEDELSDNQSSWQASQA